MRLHDVRRVIGFSMILEATWLLAEAEAHPLDTLPPGQWYEVPSSHVESQFPTPRPAGNSGPAAVIDAWGGGAFDSARDRLFIWGGGHGDYGGNEIYVFDVETMAWSRPWGPEPVVTTIPPECSSTYAGGTPSSRHTYDGIEFIPTTGQMWASGGFRFCGNTSDDAVTWLFDFVALKWTQGQNALESVGTPTSAWDSRGQRVLYQAQNVLQAYDPAADKYTKLGEVDGGFWATAVSAVDVEHDLFLSIADGRLRVWNLGTKTFTSNQPTAGGAKAMVGQPGVEWDPNLKRVVTWTGGTSVYSLDVDSWTWFEHTAASSNTVTPTAPVEAGTYGRFRYMPSRNAYVVVNKSSENVFFYKLTAGNGTPVPPADAGVGGSAGGGGASGQDASGGASGGGGSMNGVTGGASGSSSGSGGGVASPRGSNAGCGCRMAPISESAPCFGWLPGLLLLARRRAHARQGSASSTPADRGQCRTGYRRADADQLAHILSRCGPSSKPRPS
jgi:hypothetical protein